MLRFLIFMSGLMAFSTSMADDASPCSFDVMPTQFVIEDGDRTSGTGPVVTSSVTRLSSAKNPTSHVPYSIIPALAAAVTERVADHLARENLCIDNNRSLLQFAHWYLQPSGIGRITPVTRLDVDTWPSPPSGCRLYSPWIDLAIERKPTPWIRAIVRWNERQLVADQAMLAGVKNVPLGIVMPLTNHEYGRFRVEYADSEIRGKSVVRLIEERVPPDLLWMFRHSDRPYGEAKGKRLEYTKLVLALIDRCFASGAADFHYNSILDVTDLISLDQYKVDVQSR